jgi:hypothetical protein
LKLFISHGHLGGGHGVGHVDELPAADLGAEREVHVSVMVSCCQPPASMMAVLRQMPAVPLKLKKRPERLRRDVLDHEVAVQHQ